MPLYSTILIVDDERNSREGLKQFLQAHDYEAEAIGDALTALEIIKRDMPDIILTDLRMPDLDGLELLVRIKKLNPDAIVIVFTAYGSVENAVKAMQMGAFHYLTKPVNLHELLEIVKKAVNQRHLEQENKELKLELKEKYEPNEIVYASSAMQAIIDTAQQVAASTASVMITGESGTGKELIARLIHNASDRAKNQFVAVHCASLTETLLASELFGHEKGAFTGAVERKIGRFERAHKGTLFLDEIGEIREEMQVKLLRVLQEGEIERVGGSKTISVDVRIVAATNKNLIDEIKSGRFREDLYYRLNVVAIELPPLRDRTADIAPLLNFYLNHYAKLNHKPVLTIDKEALALLVKYSWPGNIRELKNSVERMVVLSKENVISVAQIPADIRRGYSPLSTPVTMPTQTTNLKNMERQTIIQTLQDLNGNKVKVAKKLGISRRTLYRKLAEYGM